MSSRNFKPYWDDKTTVHLYVQRSYLLHITFNSTQRRLKRAITPCYYKSDMRGKRSSRSWRTWWYRSNRSCRPPFPSARTAAGRKPSMARSAPTSVWGKVSYSRCLWLLCPLTSKQSFPFFFWVFESINRVISQVNVTNNSFFFSRIPKNAKPGHFLLGSMSLLKNEPLTEAVCIGSFYFDITICSKPVFSCGMIIALKFSIVKTCTTERVLNKNDIVFIIRLIQHLMVLYYWKYLVCLCIVSVKLSYYTECCAFQIRDNGNSQKG